MKEIPIQPGFTLLVDDQFGDAMSKHTWRPFRRGHRVYAKRTVRNGKRLTTEYAHRAVLKLAGLTVPPRVRFSDGNGLNVQLSNLPIA